MSQTQSHTNVAYQYHCLLFGTLLSPSTANVICERSLVDDKDDEAAGRAAHNSGEDGTGDGVGVTLIRDRQLRERGCQFNRKILAQALNCKCRSNPNGIIHQLTMK